LNELKGFNKDEIKEKANMAFDAVLSVVSYLELITVTF
jgi:hypothetical protein